MKTPSLSSSRVVCDVIHCPYSVGSPGVKNISFLRKSDPAERRIFVSVLESETLAELCVAAICRGGQCVRACVCL